MATMMATAYQRPTKMRIWMVTVTRQLILGLMVTTMVYLTTSTLTVPMMTAMA